MTTTESRRNAAARRSRGPANGPLPEVERRLIARVRGDGLLLFTDPRLPSVVSVITGSPPIGSWFAHPAAQRIYTLGERMEERPEILIVPLLRGKATLVHRRLWPALLGAATSGEPWQMRGLAPAHRTLFHRVERDRLLNVQRDVQGLPLPRGRTVGDLARTLERRLLVYGRSIHSPTGRHEKELMSWDCLRSERRIVARGVSPNAARSLLEGAAAASLGPDLPSRLFPWQEAGGLRPSRAVG